MNKEFKEAYAALAKDKTQRDALAALLIEYIDPKHVTEDVVGLFLVTRSLNPGDALN